MKVTFCGHMNIPQEYIIEEYVYEEIIKVINNGADTFYINSFGTFNSIAARILHNLKKDKFPYITIIAVSCGTNEAGHILEIADKTIEITNAKDEDTYKRRCLKAMKLAVDKSDGVICFVTNFITMSFLIYNYIKKKNKIIINLKKQI